jgi:serine/threonine-protein kinase
VGIIGQVAKALHAAHQVGLLHRDVKPSNILLDRDDFGYLIDFGIARAADETRLTKSGNTIGTFAYIAPERLGTRAEEDARADIYSLACVLYECLTGRPPFDEATMAQLVAAHLNTPPPQPSTVQPNVPAQFDAVIAKGMAKNPHERYATTVELARNARDAITVPIPPPAPSPAPNPPAVAHHRPPQPPPEQVPAYAGRPGSAAAGNQRTVSAVPPARPNAPSGRGSVDQRRNRRTRIVLIAAGVAVIAIVAVVVVSLFATSPSKITESPLPSPSPSQIAPGSPPQSTPGSPSPAPPSLGRNQFVMPDLTGMLWTDAEPQLRALGWTGNVLGGGTEAPSSDQQRKRIIFQDPAPGGAVNRDASILVVFAS